LVRPSRAPRRLRRSSRAGTIPRNLTLLPPPKMSAQEGACATQQSGYSVAFQESGGIGRCPGIPVGGARPRWALSESEPSGQNAVARSADAGGAHYNYQT
jgi:hypothetical protein